MKILLIRILMLFAAAVSGSVAVEAQTLMDYVKQQEKEAAEKERAEKIMYEKACKKGTLAAFREYAKKYPKGKYIGDINKRIADFDMWAAAAAENTLEAYNAYLHNSKFLTFKSEANDSIKALESIEEWRRVKNSDSMADVETFILNYPASACIPDAKRRMHELTGVNLYNSGEMLAAIDEFNEAGGRSALQPANQALYDKCKEYCDYVLVAGNATEAELQSFLSAYPNGQYSDDVSNKIAILKAKEFTIFTTRSYLSSALSYAKNEETRAKVRHAYDAKMIEYARYQKEQRRQRRKEDGGIVTFGIEFMDMAFNPESTNDDDVDIDYKMYYNVGLSLKLGNYKSPVQFEVGIKFGLTSYSCWDYYYGHESKISYHIPFYARLKIGLGGGDSYKWFIDGIGYYNKIKDSFLESDYSWSAGLGVGWRHIDWRIIYYKQDINPVDTYSDFKFLGTSLIYYF